MAKRISEGVFQQEVSPDRISLLTHGMHWSYGTGWGAVYGLAQGTIHAPTLGHGLLFGTGVWAMSYVELVPMGLYEPLWKYSPSAIATEVGYHSSTARRPGPRTRSSTAGRHSYAARATVTPNIRCASV